MIQRKLDKVTANRTNRARYNAARLLVGGADRRDCETGLGVGRGGKHFTIRMVRASTLILVRFRGRFARRTVRDGADFSIGTLDYGGLRQPNGPRRRKSQLYWTAICRTLNRR